MPGVASTRPIGSLPEETTQDACGGDVSTNSSTDLGSAEVQAATETPQARDIRDLRIGIDPRSGRRLPHLVAIARPGGGPAGPRSFNLYGQQDAISDSDALVPAEELDRGSMNGSICTMPFVAPPGAWRIQPSVAMAIRPFA